MNPTKYFNRLSELVGDKNAIDDEKSRFDELILKLSLEMKSAIKDTTVPGLIWHLTSKEIGRMSPNMPVSDFPAQARHLRALAASIPFDTGEIGDDPRTDQLLAKCDEQWPAIFVREMLEDLKEAGTGTKNSEKQRIACMMSLLGAIQLEITYTEQAERRIQALFGPFSSDIIAPRLGLGVEEILRAFEFIKQEISSRLSRVSEKFKPMFDEHRKFQNLSQSEAIEYFRNRSKPDPKRLQVARSYQDGVQLLNRFLILSKEDLSSVLGAKVDAFFSAFSFVPGHVNQSYLTPFDEDVVRSRPFAKLCDATFLVFDFYYAPFSPLYRLMECFQEERQLQKLRKHRDALLENDAKHFFTPVVNAEISASQYYVAAGKDGVVAERDLLLFREGILILIESKAKPLRDVSLHRGNVKKIEGDFKSSVRAGYEQACSVWRCISSSIDDVVLYDSDRPDRRELARIRRDAVREVHAIVFVDSYYGFIGTDVSPWLDQDTDVGFPWVVDRDTCETIVSKIDDFEKLVAFLRWRKTLHGKVMNEDEAVFAGYFVRHGAVAFPESADLVTLDPAYTDVFEADYYRRMGIRVDSDSSNITKPVFVSMRRVGNKIVRESGGKLLDEFDLDDSESGLATAIPGLQMQTNQPIESSRALRVGRNEVCPCGSLKKFKHCCMRNI